nr:MAG TPA: hypothetical protein [Caudoviricetes sp.]
MRDNLHKTKIVWYNNFTKCFTKALGRITTVNAPSPHR